MDNAAIAYDIQPHSIKRGPQKLNIQKPPKVQRLLPIDTRVPLLFVTSFSPSGYDEYGRKFLETFIQFWPKDALLAVFHENQRPPFDDPRILYFNLLEDQDLQDFMLRFGDSPKARGLRAVNGQTIRDFRFDALRFAPKVFALTSPILPTSNWRVWIDADVETVKQIPDSFFSKLLRNDKAVAMYLGRPREVFRTSECGFVAYRAGSEAGRQFLLDFRLNYTAGKVLEMPETHDSFVFDALRAAYEDAGCEFVDLARDYYEGIGPAHLTFEEHGHPWPHTRLGEYLQHNKGPEGKRKAISHELKRAETVDLQRICADPKIKSRYEQLVRILEVVPHETIVEVGVAQGERGVQMCRVNLSRGRKVHYIGFDLFEDLDDATAAAELNGKKVGTQDEVAARFKALADEFPGLLTADLVKGNTKHTLPGFRWPSDGVDFVFLDGGHSIETIKSDFDAVKDQASLIVLDDYYLAGQDTTKYGCNSLVDGLKTKAMLPVVDRFGNGQEIQMVATGPALGAGKGGPKPMRIKTRNCVDDPEIQANITNAARYTESGLLAHVRELQKTYADDPKGLLAGIRNLDPQFTAQFLPSVLRPVETPVLFIGGAPTVCDEQAEAFEGNWTLIRELAATHKVVVCKTSYGLAFKQGVVPWACFLLDPRDHVAEWLNPPDCRVLYLIASMCHPSTWAHLARPGFRILGYHAGVGAQEGPTILKYFGDSPIVHGGTTSSFRGLSLLFNLGFRHFKTIGLDSSYPTKPEKAHGRSIKPVHEVTLGADVGMERKFWTDPELIAQSQDAEMLTKLHPTLDIQYLGDGLLQHAQAIYRKMMDLAKPLDHRPDEHRLAAWFQAFRHKSLLPEALFIDDILKTIQKRAQNLADLLAKQQSFEELYGLPSDQRTD